MQQRVQKILSSAGVASRRRAEEMILAGRVTVNGMVCSLGMQADPDEDEIRVDGQSIACRQEHVYIMLHKPRGYVTTLSDEKHRRTAADLIDCETRVYPVGRLDMDSEGLLLFTNDGALANALMHPALEVHKCYRVWLSNADAASVASLSKPIVLDGYQIRPPEVRCLWLRDSSACLEITIHEGRNRQIRRMAEAAGMKVSRLKRMAEGSLSLGNLPKGQWRYLTPEEISSLFRECGFTDR